MAIMVEDEKHSCYQLGNKHEFLDKDLNRILLFPVAHNFDIAKSLVR